MVRRRYQCYGCRYQFSPVTGTPFEGSRLAIETLLKAIQLACQQQSLTVAKFASEAGVPYRTGWLLLRRIRAAIRSDSGFCRHFGE
jgi:transposase-like protein